MPLKSRPSSLSVTVHCKFPVPSFSVTNLLTMLPLTETVALALTLFEVSCAMAVFGTAM